MPMQSIDVLEILQGWDADELLLLISALNRQGIISDEDDSGLSSTMVEKWTDACEAFLRTQGYQGGKIKSRANYFNNHGAIYALYDSSALTYEEALKYLKAVDLRPLP